MWRESQIFYETETHLKNYFFLLKQVIYRCYIRSVLYSRCKCMYNLNKIKNMIADGILRNFMELTMILEFLIMFSWLDTRKVQLSQVEGNLLYNHLSICLRVSKTSRTNPEFFLRLVRELAN